MSGSDPTPPPPSGIVDLATLLATLTVSRRPGEYVFVGPLDGADLPPSTSPGIEALIREDEGWTVVAERAEAEVRGWPIGLVCAWLTLDVHSALEAVGLTAAVATALTAEGIPANVVAASLHDHLLVPVELADRAIAAVERLGRGARS